MFIAPPPSFFPGDIHVFTTTRVYPESVASGAKASWQKTAHIKGAKLETDFAAHGAPLENLLPSPPLWVTQVHGIAVADMDAVAPDAERRNPPEADASVTRRSNQVLAILTADCLPVVFVSEDGAIAAAHAGWRGLSGGVLEAAFAAMRVEPGAKVSAWLAPAISRCAFEVGEDVRLAFGANGDEEIARCFTPSQAPDKYFCDLYAIARIKLGRLGISNIAGGEHCTFTESDRFYSYRRAKDEGRMATFAWRAQS
jgi:YfiH family protein